MNKTIKFLCFGFLIAGLFFSSCGSKSLKQADAAKAKLQYKYAADLYTKLSSQVKDKDTQMRARREAANCYRMAEEYDKAVKAYEKVIKKEPKNTDALYYLGVNKMAIAGDCNPEALREARKYFKTYLEEVPNDEKVLKKLAGIDSAESWKKQAPLSRFKVTNFKPTNSSSYEYSPMIGSKKDDVLYFTTDRIGGPSKKKVYGWTNGFHDLWMLKGVRDKKNKKDPTAIKWGKPEIVLGNINTKFNDGTCAFDRKFSTMYYTQCNGADGKGAQRCVLMSATFNGTDWTDELVLPFCTEDSSFYGHPSLSEDGKRLYFTSDRDGGYGGSDIWMVVYNQRAKSWGDPINLGETINTEQNEAFPYWNSHDQNLYFSSTGHLGIGGFDIFRTEGSGTEWTEPENLRAPLNSGGDDFSITFNIGNPDHGFITSNRCDGKGHDDIYEFKIVPLVIDLIVDVYECIPPDNTKNNLTKPLANSIVTITNDKDSNKVVLKTDANGRCTAILKEKINYEITCTNQESYKFDAEPKQFTTKGIKNSTTIYKDFCLKSQYIDIVLPIYYDLDKAFIRQDAAKVMSEVILPLMKKYPKLRMELGSHTDCRSSYDYNIDLSQRRADSAVAWLAKNGIDARRLVAKGYGESQLVNNCACEGTVKSGCSEDEHQKNRRTTFKTLDINFDPNLKEIISSDKNNTNVKAIIVKLRKLGTTYTSEAAGNNLEATSTAIIPGADMSISMPELKKLVEKGLIKPTDLLGITAADILAGKLKPNATVKLGTLRLGGKERGFNLMNQTLKINAGTAPYTLGYDALKAIGAIINTEDDELVYKNINTEALKGGPIESNATKGNGTTGNTGTKPVGTTTTPIPPKVDSLNLDDYKRITLINEGGDKMVPTMVNDKENVNWKYDLTSKKIEITEAMAEQLLESRAIEKGDFEEGESFKTASGKKMKSNVFIIKTLQIGDVILENVKVTISNKVDVPTIGALNMAIKKINPIVKGDVLYMKPKEKKVKPGDQ